MWYRVVSKKNCEPLTFTTHIPDNLLATHYTLLTKQENNEQQTCTRETRDKQGQCSMLRLNYIGLRLILYQDPFRVLRLSLYFLLFLLFTNRPSTQYATPTEPSPTKCKRGGQSPQTYLFSSPHHPSSTNPQNTIQAHTKTKISHDTKSRSRE
jgi:hypothetical protein